MSLVRARRATTRHLSSIYPFHPSSGIAMDGVYMGVDLLAGRAPFRFDPFAAYHAGLVTNPNVVIIGEPGSGKSALIKTLLSRTTQVLGRWVAIADPKGEYLPLADQLGLTRLRLTPRGGHILNPLTRTADEPVADVVARHTATVTALASVVLRRDLDPLEDAALAVALTRLTDHPGEATLTDLIALLATPTSTMTQVCGCPTRVLAERVGGLRLALVKLTTGRFAGMFDQPSTVTVDAAGPGVVIDLSAVHTDPDLLTLVLIAVTGWLTATLTQPGPARIQVLDEAWSLLATPQTARYLQTCLKLGRAYGIANLVVVHRLSDLSAQADDGTATTKIAAGLLADCATRIVFRQAADQLDSLHHLLDLTQPETALAGHLVRGRALWKLAAHTAVIDHQLTPDEEVLCNTDQHMHP